MKLIIIITLLVTIIISVSCRPVPPTGDIVEPIDVVDEIVEPEDNLHMVSHSEYWSGEEGQIIARLLNWQGEAIVANCSVDIQNPDKTYFVENGTMVLSVDSYYYNFTTPSTEGVYEYKATCEYGSKSRSVMNSFHLSPALNFIQLSHDNLSGQIVDLTDLNNVQFGNITYNLTQIKTDTDYIRNNLVTNTSLTETQSDVLSKLNNISSFCGSEDTIGSVLCSWVNETRNRLVSMNTTVDSYLYVINQTTDTSADVIIDINQTVSGLGQFTQDDRDLLTQINTTVAGMGEFTSSDRTVMEKIYNCTILGQGCYLNDEKIWNYSGRYIHGEII